MPYYLSQVSYTPEAWATLLKTPSDVAERNRQLIEAVGGRFVGIWYAFGEYDVVLVAEYPDNVSAAAVSMIANAGGAGKAIKTTPLMTVEEGTEAMKKAGALIYTPPGE